jgi:hypothetical protein
VIDIGRRDDQEEEGVRTSRFGIAGAAVVIAAGTFATAGAQAATVTVGSPLTGSFTDTYGGPVTDFNVALPEPGAKVTSPVNGTVVRWRAIVGHAGTLALRDLKPVSGGAYTAAGSSPAIATATGIQEFSANLPVKAGDFIGLDMSDVDVTVMVSHSVADATIEQWSPPLADGSSAPPDDTFTSSELGYNADVRYCLVPALKGKKLGAAKQALSDAGCSTGSVTKPKKKKKGKAKFVKSQSVAPGTSLADGAPVDLKLRAKPKKHK